MSVRRRLQICRADHYGTYLYVRNLRTDKLWCNTYAPLDVMPESYHVSFASDKMSYLRDQPEVFPAEQQPREDGPSVSGSCLDPAGRRSTLPLRWPGMVLRES